MTRRERRSCDSARRLAFALALAVSVWTGLSPASPQEVEDITGWIEKYRGILALASQKLDDLDLPEALARFTEVIDGYKAGKLPTTTPLTRQIVGQAYEGRARTYANLGRNAEAEADFEALIRFDVTWPIDRTRTSPKIVALYDKVRKRIVGTLAIQTEPPGAVVSLNGEPLGRSPIFDRELPAGSYTLRIEAAGFMPITDQVTLGGGSRLDRTLRLTPNARSILVATSPAGARVSLDGQETGATFGVAGPEYVEVAARLGLTPADISSPLLVEHLAPGKHLLKMEKECYEPQLLEITVAIDPNDNAPLQFEPIRLTASHGSLAVESSPEGAEVLLDGKPAGQTPARLEKICSGRHPVVLRHEAGQWIGSVDIAKGQKVSLNERLRMTLAYVGMTAAGSGGRTPAGEEELGEALAGMKNFNVLRPGAGLPQELLARKLPGGSDLTSEYITAVAAATGADLILAVQPGEGAFERRVELILQGAREPLIPLRDRLRISLDDKAQLTKVVAGLDELTPLTGPWLGLEAIERHAAPNPTVIRVHPESPAAKAGVKLGESVVSLGGKPIAVPRDLAVALAGLKEGSQASLTLQAPGAQPRQVNVAVGSTPVMVPLDGTVRLNSRLAAEMAFRARMESALGRPRSPERSTALLNLGVALMRAGQCEAALTAGFQQAQLSDGAGISLGTVSYLQGVCLQRLNRVAEARQQLTAAASQPDATLWSNGGPPVAERARRLLASLPGA